MFIGIDIGGTFTDGVVLDGNDIVAVAKEATATDDIGSGILAVLDTILADVNPQQVKRIVLSTTLVTNIVITGRGAPAALILMPGYGLPHDKYTLGSDQYFIDGAIDFRGREIEAPNREAVGRALAAIRAKGIERIAVAGKFSNRNPKHEQMVKGIIRDEGVGISCYLSSDISGRLNFPRRAATTYFTAMVLPEWLAFSAVIEQAIKARCSQADIYMLKADGGTIPLSAVAKSPCETIFSGPAASTMGAAALTGDLLNSVVIDIGGTTCDISLLIEGRPLYATKGAALAGHYLNVDAFAVKSAALGGDSLVYYAESTGTVEIAPYREGPALCFGGPSFTVTDVFNVHHKLHLGEWQLSQNGAEALAAKSMVTSDQLCARLAERVVLALADEVRYMFTQWENEPAYKVWEVMNKTSFRLDQVVGVGAAAEVIIPEVARHLSAPAVIHRYAAIANAIGAAVSRPTLAVRVHADTGQKIITADPGGEILDISSRRDYKLEDIKQIALKQLQRLSAEQGMGDYVHHYKFFWEEQFNVLQGWSAATKIIDVGVQITPGFIDEFKGVK